jgi:hypothetical protein
VQMTTPPNIERYFWGVHTTAIPEYPLDWAATPT